MSAHSKSYLMWTSWLTLISAMALIAYITYLTIFPFKTIEVKQQPSPVHTPVLKAGENLVFTFDYCRYSEKPSTLNRTLRGNYIYHYTPIESAGTPGCRVLTASVTLPDDIEPGVYFLLTVNSTKVNPFQTITVQHITDTFEVIE